MTTEHELSVDRDIKLAHLDLAINWLRMISARGLSPSLTEQELADIDQFLSTQGDGWPLASQQGERNQCDGCQAGIPLDENGSHRMGSPGGYPDLMSCQKERYEHPEQAEGAQGEREDWSAFDNGVDWSCFPGYLIDHCEGDTITEEGLQYALSAMLKDDDYLRIQSEKARAALAQPSPKSGDYSDQEWINAGCPTEQPSPAQELERPEVVGWRRTSGSSSEPLMTVAQHERILRKALGARDDQYCDCGMEGWNACLDELARLNGKAVSEGLLRRMLRDWESNDTVALWGDMEELQELLGEGKES